MKITFIKVSTWALNSENLYIFVCESYTHLESVGVGSGDGVGTVYPAWHCPGTPCSAQGINIGLKAIFNFSY